RARVDRPLPLHQRDQSLARRRGPPARGRDDVGDHLCRRQRRRVRKQPDLARGRPARHLVAGSHRARSARGEAAGGRSDVTQETRPVTLITGASAGIGAALAHEFAAHGHELVLVARREGVLTALADAIAAKGMRRPTVLPADLGRPDAVRDISNALARQGLEPDVVVNNAAFGLRGTADKLDRAEQLAMIDLNVRALTDFSLAFIDSLKRRRGGILN